MTLCAWNVLFAYIIDIKQQWVQLLGSSGNMLEKQLLVILLPFFHSLQDHCVCRTNVNAHKKTKLTVFYCFNCDKWLGAQDKFPYGTLKYILSYLNSMFSFFRQSARLLAVGNMIILDFSDPFHISFVRYLIYFIRQKTFPSIVSYHITLYDLSI